MTPLKYIVKILSKHRLLAVLQALSSFVEGVLEAFILALIARIGLQAVSEVQSDAIPFLSLEGDSLVLLALVAAVATRFVVGVIAPLVTAKISTQVVLDLRRALLEAYQASGFLEQQEFGDGELQQLLGAHPLQVGSIVGNFLGYISSGLIMLAMLGLAFTAEPIATLGVVATILLLFIMFLPLRHFIRMFSARLLYSQEITARSIEELSELAPDAFAFGVSTSLSNRVTAAMIDEANVRRRTASLKGLVSPVYIAMTFFIVTIGLAFGQSAGPDKLATYAPVLLIVIRSLGYGQSIQQASSALSSLGPLIERIERAKQRLAPRRTDQELREISSLDRIDFQKVELQYPGSSDASLRDVTLSIERGERVGVVGPSGAGKTTFVRLLLGLVAPTGGTVLINGIPLSQIAEVSLRRQTAVVPQRPSLLQGSVFENVVFFRDELDREDVEYALEASDLLDCIHGLPNGMDTLVGPGFHQFSGGQAQRLMLARARVREAGLVVLDEPTSSVDLASEGRITDSLKSISGQSIVVIISHRTNVLRNCSKLMVVSDGTVEIYDGWDSALKSNSYVQSIANEVGSVGND